jgi:hypothetical protein
VEIPVFSHEVRRDQANGNAAPFFSFFPQLSAAFLVETLKPDMLGIVSYQLKGRNDMGHLG